MKQTKYKIEPNYGIISSYFNVYLLAGHLYLDGHNVTLRVK
jgi:hypothetical protein